MSDGVNRIVPPSSTLERAGSINRERDGKNRQEQRRKAEDSSLAAPPEAPNDGELLESEEGKSKGKNIDIKA